jgi:hypothetical protein
LPEVEIPPAAGLLKSVEIIEAARDRKAVRERMGISVHFAEF